MELDKTRIGGVPAIIWGGPSDRMIIAAHGSHSSKIDDCICKIAYFFPRMTTKRKRSARKNSRA